MPRLVEPAVPAGSLARLQQPTITDDELTLRPWLASDLETIVSAYSDPGIQKWHARSMTEEEAAVWIAAWPDRWKAETGAGWAVVTESGALGQISLRSLNLTDGLAEISYWVLPAARGQRVASRALSTLTAWAFDVLKLHRIEVAHSIENKPSCRVADNAGFAFEGTKRGEALHADGWHDMHLHARLTSN
ncbi:MAG TPA: GNAT family N-acetyltransferase [Actinomycetes bacterium]|nr:GNAT family N-acetyltransferase [Actinomycetes bacterium]